MAIIYGFAGIGIKENYISFSPKLPSVWDGLKFKVNYEGAVIEVHMARQETVMNIQGKDKLLIKVDGKVYTLQSKETLTIKK